MLNAGLQSASIERSSPTWDCPAQLDWRDVDRALRGIASRRAALDAQEARWLREAERLQIWKPLGMVSAIDYLERVLGYTPHAANERLRVARDLGELPVLSDAFARGDLQFTAVRELTRVATPSTETKWCMAAHGKNVRQIEELVAGRRRGSSPEDPRDPKARRHVVRFELSAEVFARLRQVRAQLTAARGAYVDDDQLVTQLCDAVLERASLADCAVEPTGRAKFQIAVTVCERCDRATQDGGGVTVPIDAAALERARCHAQHIGSIDGDAPARASQDIPPSVVRFVWRRDRGRCRTPGCRSSVGLEAHHVVHRADGGGHDPSNLRVHCSACHLALHRGTLEIRHLADGQLEVRRPHEPRAAGDPAGAKLDAAIQRSRARDAGDRPEPHCRHESGVRAGTVRTQACSALVGMGWKPAIARVAVDEACSHMGPEVTIESLIRESLRHCPKPTG